MGNRYFPWLLALAGLFLLRVLAQLLQAVQPVSFLPPFQAWHGAVLPYPLLVISQVFIILVLATILFRVKTDAIRPKRWKYRVCFTLGGIYFTFMAFRLISGLTFLGEHPWFSKHLPAFFHVVLASFVLMLGHYIYQRAVAKTTNSGERETDKQTKVADSSASETGSRLIVIGSYPTTILLGFAIFLATSQAGTSVTIASFIAVLIGVALITLHEIKLPYRKEWNPNGGEIGNDVVFMITVQIALPYLLSISVVVALSEYLQTNGFTIQSVWPHDASVAVQVCLMLLIADFLRYWMHRAFHNYTPMWRFHAVHHSPHRLYWDDENL